MYTSLNDAAANTGNPAYAKGATRIWYMNEEGWQRCSLGAEFMRKHPELAQLPTSEADLKRTHILLGSIAEKDLNAIYGLMQGEAWSPMGEARNLIRGKGLHHTSMSVGDVIQIGSSMWMVDRSGFEKLTANGGGKRRHAGGQPSVGALAADVGRMLKR
jgi:hypothetical protein